MAIIIDLSGQVDGEFTIEDDGIVGNNTSIVRRPNGTIATTFVHPADSLTIISRPGQNVTFNTTDAFTTTNITIGSLVTAGLRPDGIKIGNLVTGGIATFTTSGAITEFGSDAANDVTAGTLLMLAGTGIGAGNAIETQVATLEAESTTGGINLSNFGTLTIGGAGGSASLRGLFTSTSGNINLVNQGAIILADETGIESVHSAGNLTLSAIGVVSDISSNVDQDSLLAVGNISLRATRDVNFGTVGLNFDNDVRAGGSIFINAGRDFHMDGFSDMAANDQGLGTNGGVTITAGRDILIDDINGTDASVGVSSGTGSVVLTTGVGGSLVLHAASTAAVFAGAGGVTVRADRILIEADSGISVTGGGVATLTTFSAGQEILVGSAADGVTALELSDAELDRIFATNVTIGGSEAGTLTVVGALTHPNANLTLRTGGEMFVNANITTPTGLFLIAGENITQAINTTLTTGTFVGSVDTPDFDPAGGTVTLNGALVAPSMTLNGNADNDTLNGNNNENFLFGSGGNDTLRGFGGNDTLNGGSGNDTLDGGLDVDFMDGGLGDDVYFVDASGDVVAEGVGNGFDTVFTSINYTLGSGTDRLVTADPSLTTGLSLTGNEFANEITGNAGGNIINGGAGADLMVGAGGDDIYFVDNAGDVVSDAPGGGFDTVFSSISFNLDTLIERVVAADTSATTALNFNGNEFTNEITGNNGSNMIDGRGGADLLFGNGGGDAFLFTTSLGGGNIDSLPDFQPGVDRIYLDDAIFTTLSAGALPAGAFTIGTAAGDADDRIVYNPVSGALLYDADGNGAGAAIQFATLHEALAMTASDFQVI